MRVQSDFGGTATRAPLTADLADAARTVLAAAPSRPACARVDLVRDETAVRGESTGWSLLELVEPELFFLLAPEVAGRLAEIVVGGVGH